MVNSLLANVKDWSHAFQKRENQNIFWKIELIYQIVYKSSALPYIPTF
jgi:hypothetical protein